MTRRGPLTKMVAVLGQQHPITNPGPCAGLCGDAGLARLYRDHHASLLARARHLLGDAQLAEDAVQEVFVRAWRACPTLDPAGGPLRGWLSTVLRNVVIDQVRARASRPVTVGIEPGADPADQEDAVEALVIRAALADALARVGAPHRDAVLATVVRDRPYQEVAAELCVPVGTVRSRVFYGLRKLRAILEAPAAA